MRAPLLRMPMPPLFSRSADSKFRLVLALLVVTPALALGGMMALARSPLATQKFEPIPQPIEFDHRHHSADEGIDCRYCHRTVATSAYAGFPATEVCMGCHAQIWNRSELLGQVRKSYFQDRPIAWNWVHRLPDYVYFNHQAHVTKGVGCVSCHGRVDQMAAVARAVPLNMGWCLDCHRNPTPNLVPISEVTHLSWTVPPEAPRFREELARAYQVRSRTECITCHR